MRKPYTCLYREIWDDPRFYRGSTGAQLAYLFLLSAPAGNGIGCFRAGIAAMADDLRRDVETFRGWFDECLRLHLCEYDPEHRVVWIPQYLDRNPPANPNGVISISKDFAKIPECDLKLQCYRTVERFCKTKGAGFAQTFAERFEEPCRERPGNDLPLPLPATCNHGGRARDVFDRDRDLSALRQNAPLDASGSEHPLVSRARALWPTWSTIDIERSIIRLKGAHPDLTDEEWEQVLQVAHDTEDPSHRNHHTWIYRQAEFFKRDRGGEEETDDPEHLPATLFLQDGYTIDQCIERVARDPAHPDASRLGAWYGELADRGNAAQRARYGPLWAQWRTGDAGYHDRKDRGGE